MKQRQALSALLNEGIIAQLRQELSSPRYAGIKFEQAMQFFLTDGILPRSQAPVAAFLELEDWLRSQAARQGVAYTASDLKNKTGEILDRVLRGDTIRILKHGREVARLVPTGQN